MPTRRAQLVERDGCVVKIVHLSRVAKAKRHALKADELERLSLVYKAMGDPTRLSIITAHGGGEMCVCDLSALLSVSDSAVSHQLRRLRDLALVKSRRDGQVLYYSIADDHVAELIRIGLEHVRE